MMTQQTPSTNTLPMETPASITTSSSNTKKQLITTFTIIFSIWNTMVGSSLLSLPWGFSQSGLVGGLVVIPAMGLITWYTMSLVLRNSAGVSNYSQLCAKYLGLPGSVLAWIGSVLVLGGAAFVYFILFSTNVYSLVEGILRSVVFPPPSSSTSLDMLSSDDDETPVTRYWTPVTAPIIVAAAFFPLLNVPSMSFYVKLSGFGIVGLLYVMFFIFTSSIVYWGEPIDDVPVVRNMGVRLHAFHLAGVMSLAFLVHNFVIQMTSNSSSSSSSTTVRQQEEETKPLIDTPKQQPTQQAQHPHLLRDVSIGFGMGGLTYAAVGGIAYGALGDSVPQDILELFPRTSLFAMSGRVAIIFQLGAVLPMLFSIVRTHFFTRPGDVPAVKGQPPPHTTFQAPLGFLATAVYTLLMLTCSVLLAIFFPQVGDVLRFTGAGCGLLSIFILPVLIDIFSRRTKGKSVPIYVFILSAAVVLTGIGVILAQFF